jgi:hypothetical protein
MTKMKTVIGEKMRPPPDMIINERQKIIDKLNIKEGFPELVWKHCTFTREDFLIRQENDAKLFKICRKKEFTTKLREILIPKLTFDAQERKLWSTRKGAILKDEQ